MFYTYLWLREDGTPYYVGKGSGNRAFTSWSHGVHKPSDKSRILTQAFESEEEAFEAEIFLIAYYGREDLSEGCLKNLTDGGENPPNAKGRKLSEETKKKMSARKRTPEEIKKSADSRRGSWHQSEETKKLMSEQRKGRVPWNKGKSGEYKRAPFSEETRAKMSAARIGTHPTEKTKEKISKTLKRLGFQPSKAAVKKAHSVRWGHAGKV